MSGWALTPAAQAADLYQVHAAGWVAAPRTAARGGDANEALHGVDHPAVGGRFGNFVSLHCCFSVNVQGATSAALPSAR